MEAKVYPKWIYGRYVSKMDTLEDMYPKCSYGHLDMTR